MLLICYLMLLKIAKNSNMLINTILQKSDNIAVFKTLRNVTKRTKLNYEPKGREFESLMARQIRDA